MFSKKIAALSAAVPIVLVVTGCSLGGSAGGPLAKAQQVTRTCPNGKGLGSFIGLDVSGSSRTDQIPSGKLTAIDQVATQTAICGGHLQVSLFSATAAKTAQIYDGALTLTGATQNARLIQAPKVVAAVMKRITSNYTASLPAITPSASDIVAEYSLAGEYAAQLGDRSVLNMLLLTDGGQNAGFQLRITKNTSPAQAAAEAAHAPVPQLPGASITVAGLGTQAAGAQPGSGYVANLVAFYTALCRKTHAAHCQSVTDFASGQWAA